MTEPVRVFIGAPPDGLDAECQAVCEATLRKHSSLPIDLTWMIATTDPSSPWSDWDMSGWTTPFSGFRFAVPAVCGFEGRGIYLDCDTIVRSDIAELWNMPLPSGKIVAARGGWRFCVSLFDCAKSRPHIFPMDGLKVSGSFASQISYFRLHQNLVHPLGSAWNWLDVEDSTPLSHAKIIHYSALATQPSRRHAVLRLAAQGRKHWYNGSVRKHPRQAIVEMFDAELEEAKATGFTPDLYEPAQRAT